MVVTLSYLYNFILVFIFLEAADCPNYRMTKFNDSIFPSHSASAYVQLYRARCSNSSYV